MDAFQFNFLAYSWIGIALLIFVVLVFTKIRAPYGRHTTNQWGIMIDNRWGWFWMELPALVVFPLFTFIGPSEKSSLAWLLVALWSLHYINRTLIFPMRIKTKGKKMPLTIVFSAVFFNGMNGFLNGYYLGFLDGGNEALSFANTHVWVGLSLFGVGMVINQIADTKLIQLRKENTGYVIPRGWLFERISCPNHFGEIVEWIGFAILAWSLPALTFAIWTFCNLVPRTLNHQAWYIENFSEYPKNRKAVIPYLL